jgi:hypothetical protein
VGSQLWTAEGSAAVPSLVGTDVSEPSAWQDDRHGDEEIYLRVFQP